MATEALHLKRPAAGVFGAFKWRASEVPFWLTLAYTALLPATVTPWFELWDVPIRSNDFLLVAAAAYALLNWRRSGERRTLSRRACFRLPLAALFVFAYAAASIFWSGMGWRDSVAMTHTLVTAAAALTFGYAHVAALPAVEVRPFLRRVTFFMAAVGLLYTAESFLALGLRSSETKAWTDFGIQRVRGPLFGSSTGPFLLLPFLAFALQELVSGARQRLFKLLVAVSLLVTYFSLGSRAGLLALAFFFLLLIAVTRSPRQKFYAVTLLSVVTLLAGLLVFSVATPERLLSLEDSARTTTYEAAARMALDRTAAENLAGSGYGSQWAWYLPDVEDGGANNNGRFFQDTRYGVVLYHPHSTFLLLLVELGLPGVLLALTLAAALVGLLMRARRGSRLQIFACGIASSGLFMGFDLFLFKGPAISALWWTLLFGAMALTKSAAPRMQRRASVPTLRAHAPKARS